MVDWQVTATTLYCDAVDDEVTVLIYKDWSAKCSGQKKYHAPGKETLDQVNKKSKQFKRQLACSGVDCPQVSGYRTKLQSEDRATKHG